ncbi:MAG: hypothetical protein QXR57_03985 [Metallosphaera sp.]|uniref:hypothetical protein n=1 Tax=Metallosphaera sp. TaxID=2020860 RepID=UPI003166C28F
MNYLNLGKYIGISLLFVSALVYILGDPLLRLISYQGPIISGALLGWYVIHSSTPQDRYIEDQDNEKVPVTSLLLRKRAWLLITIGIALLIPWFTPQVFAISLRDQFFFVVAFLFQVIGGFVIGYVIPSLRFMEKFILYSLGFGADLFFILLLYIDSMLFYISQTVLLNDVIILVYGIKLLEGILFGVYIVKRINAI